MFKQKLDLRDQRKVFKFLKEKKPEFVINAAAKVGGIHANNIFRADFIYDNLSIQTNIIKGCLRQNKKFNFFGFKLCLPKEL